jgi:hypothetical protein
MTREDDEIEQLKASVSCAVVLERLPPPWRLDAAESTRRSLKYRRGAGEIVIVNHAGRGWWDPLSEAKGDIFSLVRHLDPSLDFPAARHRLRGLAGLSPTFPMLLRKHRQRPALAPVAERWNCHRPLSPGSPTWRYLTEERALPAPILLAAAAADAVREGPHASAWFVHRNDAGQLTGIEMRGPAWRNFSAGGEKTLFRLPGSAGPLPRLAVTEAAIDALSLAALEELRGDTLYTATTGGIGPGTIASLQQLLQALSGDPQVVLVAATDADAAGCRFADRLAELATAAAVRCERLIPQSGLNDWNDVLRAVGR